MIKLYKLLLNIFLSLFMGTVFAFFLMFVSPRFFFLGKFYSVSDMTASLSYFFKIPDITQTHRFLIGVFVFIIVSVLSDSRLGFFSKLITKAAYERPKTKIFDNFLKKLRFCYSAENLLSAVHSELEYAGDCSVIIIDAKDDSIIYNTASMFASDPKTVSRLLETAKTCTAGAHFVDSDLKESLQEDSRIAAIILYDVYFFVVCRYLNDVEPEVFDTMFAEFSGYQKRSKMLLELLHLSELTHEWAMVAATQRAFLPQKMPDTPALDIASYFKPLVNVSGDYYYAAKIDDEKTLLVLGDVSGKGLAAALIMGIVVNTIKIAKDKEDLAGLVVAVDKAIKRMQLSDKYTVLFLGLVDTDKMTIRYINASMESPMILTEVADSYKVKILESTFGVVGIIDLDKIEVKEQKLYRGDVILMTTDGVPEIMNENGEELGETDLYLDSIKSFASGGAEEIVNNIAGLAYTYAGSAPVRDDITMLCAKVKG